MCSYVPITVSYKAGCGSITIRGGDAYPITDDLQCAAQHYGIVSASWPGPVTTNLFYTGVRNQFWMIRKNGLTSQPLLTATHSVMFASSSACPSLYTDLTPVTNMTFSYSGSPVIGAGYFQSSTTLVNDAVYAYNVACGLGTIIFLKDVGMRDRYYKSWTMGIMTTESLTLSYGFAVFETISLESLATPLANLSPARADCYTWFPSMTATFYGAGLYPHDTMLCYAQRHQYARSGDFMYLCAETQHHLFYSATMLGFTSTFQVLTTPVTAYTIAANNAGCTPLAQNVSRSRINIYNMATVNVYGYHYYRYDSDVAMASFVQGLAIPWFPKSVYIHAGGFFQHFYSGTYSDVTTTSSHFGTDTRAYYLSATDTPPTAGDIYPIPVRMYGTIGKTATGTGVYSDSSDLTNICFHYLSCNLGYTYRVYVYWMGNAGYALYSSTHRQLTTLWGGAPGAAGNQMYVSYYPVTAATIASEVNTPNVMRLLTRATTIAGGTVWGAMYYFQQSDIALAAIHSGTLKGDANETIFVHRDAAQKVYYSVTNNSIQTTGRDDAAASVSIRIRNSSAALTPYPDSTLSTVRLAVTFACLWMPEPVGATFYGITFYPVLQDLVVSAIMEHYCRPTVDHNDQSTIYVQYGHTFNRIFGTSVPTLSTKARYSATAFRVHVINDVDAQPLGWVMRQAGSATLPARLMYHGQLDTSVVYGTTPHFYWENMLSKSAFFMGVITDIAVVQLVYYREFAAMTAATRNIFVGSTHRGIRSLYLEYPADGAQVSFSNASSVPAITDQLHYLCFKEIHSSSGFDSMGTVWYDRSSNFGIAAFRENLIDFRQCAWLYVISVGTMQFYLKSTQRGYGSDGQYLATATEAFVLKRSLSDTSPATPITLGGATGYAIPFYHAVVRPWEVGKSVIVGGMNPFTHNTDATYAAYMQNILDPQETRVGARMLYLHTTTRSYYPATTSRRVMSSAQAPGGQQFGYTMHDSATRPSWVSVSNIFKLLTTIEDYDAVNPRTCWGAGVYRYDSDASVCARVQGKAAIGDMVEITVWNAQTAPNFARQNNNGLQSVQSAGASSSYVLDTNSLDVVGTFVAGSFRVTTAASDATTKFFFSMQNQSLETGVLQSACNGHQLYSINCYVGAASQHNGVSFIGQSGLVYARWCSAGYYYGTSQNGITTQPSGCAATAGFTLNTVMADVDAENCVPVLKISMPAFRAWGVGAGVGGVFVGTTPLDTALVEAGLIKPGLSTSAPTTIYTAQLATGTTWVFHASSLFFQASSTGTCGFVVSATSAGDVTALTTWASDSTGSCRNVYVRLLDPSICDGIANGFYFYRATTPLGCAAAQMGVLAVGDQEPTMVSMCRSNNYPSAVWLGATSNGIRTLPSTSSFTDTPRAYILSGGSIPSYPWPGANPSTELSYDFTITLTGLETFIAAQTNTSGMYTEVGTQDSGAPNYDITAVYYDATSTDISAAAWRQGLLSSSTRSATVQLHFGSLIAPYPTQSWIMFPSTTAPIESPVDMTIGNYTYEVLVPGGGWGSGCASYRVVGTASHGDVYGSKQFRHHSSVNLAKAAVMAGALEIGEAALVTFCVLSGTRRLWASVDNFVQSLSFTDSTAFCVGVNCTTEVAFANETKLELNLVYAHFLTGCDAVGGAMTRWDSCVNTAAWVSNFITDNTGRFAFYLQNQDGDEHCQNFYSVARGTKVLAYGTTANCGLLTVGTSTAPYLTTVLGLPALTMWVEYTLATTSPTGSYYYLPSVGTINDMLEHQQRLSIVNASRFSVTYLQNQRRYLPASTVGGITTGSVWTNLANAQRVTIALSTGWWGLDPNYADATMTPLWIGYLELQGAPSMGGLPYFAQAESDMAVVGTVQEDILWTHFRWPINNRITYVKYWVKARSTTGTAGASFKLLLHACWVHGVQTTSYGTGTYNVEFVRILTTFDTSAHTPTAQTSAQTCIQYPRAPSHLPQTVTNPPLHGTRWFSPPSDLTRAAMQEGRMWFSDRTKKQSVDFWLCTNVVTRAQDTFMALTNNSIVSTDPGYTSGYTRGWIMGGTFTGATSWGQFYDWPVANQWVSNVWIMSALRVETLIGGLDHFVRPEFDIAGALVARGDEDQFAYKTSLTIYFKGGTAAQGNIHIATSNAGLTQSRCAADTPTYLSTTTNADTIVVGRYRAYYYKNLSPRYFYHTVPYPTTNAPQPNGNSWDAMVFGSFNQYASKTRGCTGAETWRYLSAAATVSITPWYHTDIKAAYWEARFSNFDNAEYLFYVHDYGLQSRGFVSHNRFGLLTKGSNYWNEKNSGTFHTMFSFSPNNVDPTFSTAFQKVDLTSCDRVTSYVAGVGVHTGDSDPCGAAFFRRYLQIDQTGTFFLRWNYLSTTLMPHFSSGYSYGQWATPERLSRKIFYTLSTLQASQDSNVTVTAYSSTTFTITVNGFQILPSFQYAAETRAVLRANLVTGTGVYSTETLVYGAHYYYIWFSPVTDILLHGNQRRYLDQSTPVVITATGANIGVHYPQARNGIWPSNYLSTSYDPEFIAAFRHLSIQVYAAGFYHTTGYTNAACTPLFTVSPNPLNCARYVAGVGAIYFLSDISCAAWLAGKCPAWELCNVTLCKMSSGRSLFHAYNKLGVLNLEADFASPVDGWWLTKPGAEANSLPAKKTDALYCINLNCTNRPTGRGSQFPAYGSTFYQARSELCTAGVHLNIVDMDVTNIEICTTKITYASNPPQGWYYSSSRRHVWTQGVQASGTYTAGHGTTGSNTRGFVIGVGNSASVPIPALSDGIVVCPEYVQSTTCPGSIGVSIACDLSIETYREQITWFGQCLTAIPYPINSYAFTVQDNEGIGNRLHQNSAMVLHMLTDKFRTMHTTTFYAGYYAVPLVIPTSVVSATVVINPANQAVCTRNSDLLNCMLALKFINNVSVGQRWIIKIVYDGYGNYFPQKFNPTKTPTITLSLSETHSITFTHSLSGTASLSLTPTVSLVPTLTKTPKETRTATATMSLTYSSTLTSTQTISATVSQSLTQSLTLTPSQSLSQTVSQTISQSPTSTPSITSTYSLSLTSSMSLTETQSKSDTQSVSLTASLSPSATLSTSATVSVSQSASLSPSQSLSQTISNTLSLTTTQSETASLSQTATIRVSGSTSVSQSQSLSLTQTVTLSLSASQSLTVTKSDTLVLTPTISQRLSGTQSLSLSLTQTQSLSASMSLTGTLSLSVTASQSLTTSPSLSISSTLTQTTSQTQSATLSLTTSPSLTQSQSLTQTASLTLTVTPTLTQSQSLSDSVSQSLTTSGTPSMTPSETITQSQSLTTSQSLSTSQTLSVSSSATLSSTMSLSTTASLSETATLTTSASQSLTQSPTLTLTQSQSLTLSPSLTQTISLSGTASGTQSASLSLTRTESLSASDSLSITQSQTQTQSASETLSESLTVTETLSLTHSLSLTWTRSVTPPPTPTPTFTMTFTDSFSLSFSESITPPPTATPTFSETLTFSHSISQTASLSETVSASTTATLSLTSTPTLTETTSLSATVSESLTATESQSLTISQSLTETPSLTISDSLSLTHSQTPTISESLTTTQSLSGTLSETPTESLSLTKTQSLTTTPSLTLTESLSTTISESLTATESLSPTTSLSLTDTQSLSISETASLTHSLSPTITESLTTTQSISESASLSLTQSLTESQTLSLTSTPSLTTTMSLSTTLSKSLSTTLSLSTTASISETHTFSLSFSETITPPPTATPTFSETLTFSHSVSQSMSTSETISMSQTATLSLTSTPTLSETLSLSSTATSTISATDSLTLPMTMSVSLPITSTVSLTLSLSISNSITPTYYPKLKTITWGKEDIFKNPVTDEPNGTISPNNRSLINQALLDASRNPVWFLFVVCIIAAACALVLSIFIVIALYRRLKQFRKEQSMRRRAAKYLKKKKLIKRKVRRIGPNGEVIEVEIEVEVSDHDNDAGDFDVAPDAFALSVDHAAARTAGAVEFDGVESAGEAEGIGADELADFKKEYQPTVALTEKQRAREEREGKGAKLKALDIGQFNQRDDTENQHLMPTRKKENFVEDILDPEKGPKLKRLQSMSVLFTEAKRDKDAEAGTKTKGGPGRHDSMTAAEMARSVMALASNNDRLRRQLEEDGSLRLGKSGADPTSENYKEMCRRASALALGAHLTAGGLPRRRGSKASGSESPSSPSAAEGKQEKRPAGLDPSKIIGRYRRGYDEVGLPSGPSDAEGIVMDPYSLGAVRSETGGKLTPSPSGQTSPSAAKYVADKASAYLPDFEAFDFSPTAQAASTGAFDAIPAAADNEAEYAHDGPKPRPDVKLPLTAAGATGVAAPIHVTRKTGLNALNLGDDMNDFDNFEAAEDYDYTYLPGKAATAVRAEEVLATEMHQKAASELGLRARMGLGVLGGVGKLPEGAAKFASAGNRLPSAASAPPPAFDAFAGDDVLAGLDIDADIDAIAAALYQEEGVTPYEQLAAATAARPVTSQASAKRVDYFASDEHGDYSDRDGDEGALHPRGGPAEEQARPVTVQPGTPGAAAFAGADNDRFEELAAGQEDWDFGDLATEAFVMRGARGDVTKEEFDQNVEGLFDDVEIE